MVAGRSIGPGGDIICGGYYLVLGFCVFLFALLSVSFCVPQVLMELGQHLLQLWPMPTAVFPMSRSTQHSLHSSSEQLCCGV